MWLSDAPVSPGCVTFFGTITAMPSALSAETAFTLEREPGHRLRGYAQLAAPGPVGIFVHGFRSHADGDKSRALAAHASGRGYAWVRVDLSGHGESDGDFCGFRISSLRDDVLAVMAKVARPAVVVGSSMGAWLSVLAALERPAQVKGLVLLAPGFDFLATIFSELSSEEQALWQRRGCHRFQSPWEPLPYALPFEALADARAVHVLGRPLELPCPVHIIHGRRDEVVPLSVSERFLKLTTAPTTSLEIVEDGDHRLHTGLPAIFRAVDRMFSLPA